MTEFFFAFGSGLCLLDMKFLSINGNGNSNAITLLISERMLVAYFRMLMKLLLSVYVIQSYSKYSCPDYDGFFTFVRARGPKTGVQLWTATIGIAHKVPREDSILSCFWVPIHENQNLARPQEIPLPIIRKGSHSRIEAFHTDKPRTEGGQSLGQDEACENEYCDFYDRVGKSQHLAQQQQTPAKITRNSSRSHIGRFETDKP